MQELLEYRRRYIALRPVFRAIFNKFDKHLIGFIDASTFEGAPRRPSGGEAALLTGHAARPGLATSLFGHTASVRSLVWSLQVLPAALPPLARDRRPA
jgi:hypothetical protein